MTKWKCSKSDCMKSPCVLETRAIPHICPFLNLTTPEWEKQEEPEWKPGNKLPDWCKVGEYGYDYASGYFKIIEIIDNGYNLKVEWIKERVSGIVFGDNLVERKYPARLRPYNAEEMRGLVGKVLTSKSYPHFSFLVVYDKGDGSFVMSCMYRYTAEELRDKFTIDGHPCGVLEHLENGEWVE